MSPSDAASWFAVFTKPRQERLALTHLERQRFRCFLPMAENPFQRRCGQSRGAEPLFPRYLFLQALPRTQNLSLVRSTRGVVGLVRAGFELVQVPPAVIAALKSRQDEVSGLVQLAPDDVQPGQRVRVFDGPLAGLEGVFRERCSATRSLLLMSILGRESTVEVDSLLLQSA